MTTSEFLDNHPTPWSRGASTSDGEPIYDAAGNLIMVVNCPDSESVQRLIVAAVNDYVKDA